MEINMGDTIFHYILDENEPVIYVWGEFSYRNRYRTHDGKDYVGCIKNQDGLRFYPATKHHSDLCSNSLDIFQLQEIVNILETIDKKGWKKVCKKTKN